MQASEPNRVPGPSVAERDDADASASLPWRREEGEDTPRDELVAQLAHELRNPLAPIRNAAEVLRVHREELPEHLRGSAETLVDHVDRLARLIDSLLGDDLPTVRSQGIERSWRVAAAGSGRRVLVVDDHKDAADSLGLLLEMRGHVVAVAYSGEHAIEISEHFEPEVAMLDLGLPIMDGYELAGHLRKQRNGDGLLLIAVTGYGQPEDRRRSAAAGFDHHLLKPLDLEAIEDLLEESS